MGYTAGIVLGSVAAACGYTAYRLWNVRFVPEVVERDTIAVLRCVEGDAAIPNKDLTQQEGETWKASVRRRRVTATARAVASAKRKFGLIEYPTEADRMMVGKHIRDHLVDRGTHDVDICNIAPLAIELTFVPTKADNRAKAARVAAATTGRQLDSKRTWVSWAGWAQPAFRK